ncbi:MAG: division/cell wall cluster transcriptional repressor MraZ [bacterium]
MDYFLGTFEYTIDDNNRLNIPAKFRRVMDTLGQSEFVISKELKNCIVMYPYNIWKERIGDKISELPHSDEKANRLRRLLGQNTTEVSLDKQGRVNIPTDYYNHASIQKKITILGSIDTIQLWNPDNYKSVSREPEEKSLIEEFKEFGF